MVYSVHDDLCNKLEDFSGLSLLARAVVIDDYELLRV